MKYERQSMDQSPLKIQYGLRSEGSIAGTFMILSKKLGIEFWIAIADKGDSASDYNLRNRIPRFAL
jgi:hypothetical protein